MKRKVLVITFKHLRTRGQHPWATFLMLFSGISHLTTFFSHMPICPYFAKYGHKFRYFNVAGWVAKKLWQPKSPSSGVTRSKRFPKKIWKANLRSCKVYMLRSFHVAKFPCCEVSKLDLWSHISTCLIRTACVTYACKEAIGGPKNKKICPKMA